MLLHRHLYCGLPKHIPMVDLSIVNSEEGGNLGNPFPSTSLYHARSISCLMRFYSLILVSIFPYLLKLN